MRSSGIRKFFDIAAEMKDCITLGVGEPDFKTPWVIRSAGIESLNEGHTSTPPTPGMLELRREISRSMERRFQLSYKPESQVLVTVGGSEAIDLCIRALVNPGDEVIIPRAKLCVLPPHHHPHGRGAGAHSAEKRKQIPPYGRGTVKKPSPQNQVAGVPLPPTPTGGVICQKTWRRLPRCYGRHLHHGAERRNLRRADLRRRKTRKHCADTRHV